MPGMGFGFGFGFHRRASGSGASASEQLLTLATDVGALALYDPTNPSRTLRDDGADQYFSTMVEETENLPDFTQGTAANQPLLVEGHFGQLDAAKGDGANVFMTTALFAEVSQPFTVIGLIQYSTIVTTTTGTTYFYGSADGSDTLGMLNRVHNDPAEYGMFAGIVKSFGSADTNKHVRSNLYDHGNDDSELRIDGASIGTSGSAGSNGLRRLAMLARFSGGSASQHADAYFGPHFILPSVNLTDIQAVENKLHELSGVAKA